MGGRGYSITDSTVANAPGVEDTEIGIYGVWKAGNSFDEYFVGLTQRLLLEGFALSTMSFLYLLRWKDASWATNVK